MESLEAMSRYHVPLNLEGVEAEWLRSPDEHVYFTNQRLKIQLSGQKYLVHYHRAEFHPQPLDYSVGYGLRTAEEVLYDMRPINEPLTADSVFEKPLSVMCYADTSDSYCMVLTLRSAVLLNPAGNGHTMMKIAVGRPLGIDAWFYDRVFRLLDGEKIEDVVPRNFTKRRIQVRR